MDTPNLKKALEEFGVRVADEMRNALFENKSVVTGDLARSIIPTVKDDDTLVISLDWYGELLEKGGPARGPGRMPPVQPIQEWIKIKKIPKPAKFKTPTEFAYAIAKSISKEGATYPRKPFIVDSINNAYDNFGEPLITAGFELDIIDDINELFEEGGATVS